MQVCGQCNQQNPDDANFCHQCGAALSAPAAVVDPQDVSPPMAMTGDEALWREFIGPNADRYVARFRKFSSNGQPRFALSWNWPAFLFISFLWFLYRKMYLHAFVYAVGPMISTYVTGDLTVGIIWSIMAGATADYLYYWHAREQIAEVKKSVGMNHIAQQAALKEAGGVQPYVIWVGVVFYIVFLVTLASMLEEDPSLNKDKVPTRPARPAVMTTT
jgi:Protein of unknown function (DUF2628)/Double zinc ribbon